MKALATDAYATPEKYEPGSHLLIAEPAPVLNKVIRRTLRGYLVKSPKERNPSELTDDQINDLRLAERLQYFPCDPEGAPNYIKARLEVPLSGFPRLLQVIAERRQQYCSEVAALRADGMLLKEALKVAPQRVFDRESADWEKEDKRLAAESKKKALLTIEDVDSEDLKKPPAPRTLEGHYALWESYGRDIRVLIPNIAAKGNRGRRYHDEWIYDAMRFCLERYYFIRLKTTLAYAYRKFEEICKEHGLKNVDGQPRQYPTDTAFRNFKDNNYSDGHEHRKREGNRSAYLNFGVFIPAPKPEDLLAETEIDHCLADIIVCHDRTGKPIGRPWITALLDRASRMVLGMHVSFEVPSYAAVSRCLAHAFWPKNLRGIPGLDLPWPCKGLPWFVYMDNGREFHSRSLIRSSRAMHFAPQPLPVASPWLKGTIERFFGRMHVQVYDHKEGKTFANALARGQYDSKKCAKTKFSEFKVELAQWLVNDYHGKEHTTLKMPPLNKWMQLADRQGGVRPPPRFDQLIELMGEVVFKPIHNDGVHILGREYAKEGLRDLLERRGGRGHRFPCYFDPFDIGQIRLLDDMAERPEFIPIPCTNPEISRGVSFFSAKQELKLAQQSSSSGHVTEHDLVVAHRKMVAERDAMLGSDKVTSATSRAARHESFNGHFFTPIELPAPVAEDTPETVTPPPLASLKKSGVRKSNSEAAHPPIALVDDLAGILEKAKAWSSHASQQ